MQQLLLGSPRSAPGHAGAHQRGAGDRQTPAGARPPSAVAAPRPVFDRERDRAARPRPDAPPVWARAPEPWRGRRFAGPVERAQGGTLVFEDVAELDAGGQRCLRQLLGEPTYSRRGSAERRRADVRVIALTSRPLLERVRQGGFASAVSPPGPGWLDIPPLRQRRDDIPRLAAAFWPRRPRYPAGSYGAAGGHLCSSCWPQLARQRARAARVLRQALQRPRGPVGQGSSAPFARADRTAVRPNPPPRETRFHWAPRWRPSTAR